MHEADDGCGTGPVGPSQAVDEHIPPVLDLILDIFQGWTYEGDQFLLKLPLYRQQTGTGTQLFTREFPANFLHQAILNL